LRVLSAGSRVTYRDRIYIIKDIILKLVDYGELNQTALFSFCGLNMKKHKPLLDDLNSKGLIMNSQAHIGKRTITIYKPTVKGLEFCNRILDAYERMFPRDNKS
jgi:predicted transcriptional regulator